VGWQWALQMARFHDVTVLTQSKNRAGIESTLKNLGASQPEPRFIYFDLPKTLQGLRKFSLGLRIYYVIWQKMAWAVVHREHRKEPFDLLHHVTFAAFRYPAVIWGHGVPCIWGPVGGIESIPTPLLPWHHPASFLEEIFRNLSNLIQAAPFHDLPKRALNSNTVLVSTMEMQKNLAELNIPCELVPTIGLRTKELPHQNHRQSKGPLRILFVGKVITLKGIDLALAALEAAGTDATFTIVGTGNYLSAARRFVQKRGLQERVVFRGQLPREQVLAIYSEFDLFLFPSLHDTGGYAVIEAMFNELPVICLDCGGPAVAVRAGCGIKVPIQARKNVVNELADAIRRYDEDRQTLLLHGKAARETILEHYDWDEKGDQMNEIYEKTLAPQPQPKTEGPKYIRAALATRRLFSFRGSIMATFILLLVGSLGFMSLDHLKHQASLIVSDTLPGLSYAGEANAYIVDAARTLLFVTDDDPARRKKIRGEINTLSARTMNYLMLYQNQIFSDEDETNFQALIQTREKYVRVRDRILDLAASGQEKEALAVYNDQLMPAHNQVKNAADKLFEYNMRQGQARGKRIMAFCTFTQVVLAAASVLVFAIGFFFGLFK
jgi:glycosyltransferase involved in cell wall biosynthesis